MVKRKLPSVIFMPGRRYWLSPDGELIDCNRGLGHLKAILEYCNAHNISTLGNYTHVMYNAGFVRMVVTDTKVHCEAYKDLTPTQHRFLKDYALYERLTLWDDTLDRELL